VREHEILSLLHLRPASWWLVLALVACSGDDETTDTSSGAGAGPPIGCAPGTRPLDDKSCLPAGVDVCGDGFVADGEGGCVAVLPPAPCQPPQLALPGDTACRPIAGCGSGTWGDIPSDGNTEHVDPSFGGASDGGPTAPWKTIAEALVAAAPTAIIALAAGDYAEPITLGGNAVTLWGRCPEMVSLHGAGVAAIIVSGSAPVTIRGIGIDGAGRGVSVDGGNAALADLWLHDLGSIGVNVVAGGSATIANVLVDDVIDTGILVVGGSVQIDGVVVQRVAPIADGRFGRGIDVEAQGSARGSLVLGHALVELVREHGIYLSGSDATIDATLVRDVAWASLTDPGRGLNGRSNAGGASVVSVTGSVIERVHDSGIWCGDCEIAVATTTLRDTLPDPDGNYGYGIALFALTVAPPPGRIEKCALIRTATAGFLTFGASAEVESLLVVDPPPEATTGLFGRGAGSEPYSGFVGELTIRWSRFLRTTDAGIIVFGGPGVVEASEIDTVAPVAQDQSFGDGIATIPETMPGTLTITGTRVTGAARGGIANFGGWVTLGSSTIVCNGFDLDGEAIAGPFTFDDIGGNVCGCGELGPCKAFSAALSPPGPPPSQR
jgi:hypothetical protein